MSNHNQTQSALDVVTRHGTQYKLVITSNNIILAIHVTGPNEFYTSNVMEYIDGNLYIQDKSGTYVPLYYAGYIDQKVQKSHLKVGNCNPIYYYYEGMQHNYLEWNTLDNFGTRNIEDAVSVEISEYYTIYGKAVIIPNEKNMQPNANGYLGYVKGSPVDSLCLTQIAIDLGYDSPLYINQLYLSEVTASNNYYVDFVNKTECDFAKKIRDAYYSLFPRKTAEIACVDAFSYLNNIHKIIMPTIVMGFFHDMIEYLTYDGNYAYFHAPVRKYGAIENMTLLCSRLGY